MEFIFNYLNITIFNINFDIIIKNLLVILFDKNFLHFFYFQIAY